MLDIAEPRVVRFEQGVGGGIHQDTAEKKSKIWEEEVFTADMCESLGVAHEEFYAEYGPVLRIILEELLEKNLSEEIKNGLRLSVQALTRSESIFKRRQQHLQWHIPFHLSRIIDEICKQLQGSSVGDVHFFPFEVGNGSIVVVRNERGGTFSAGVVSTDPVVSSYHPYSAERHPKLLSQAVLELKNIPKSRITSEAFWACELHCETADEALIYTHFLPWLNQKTHKEILNDTNTYYCTGTKSGSGNLWKNFVHAVKYTLLQQGVPMEEVKAVRHLIKQKLLKIVKHELESLTTIEHSTRLVIKAALQNAALSLTRNAKTLAEGEFQESRQLIDSIHEKIQGLPCPDEATTKPPALLNLTEGWQYSKFCNMFPLVECHRRLEDVESFVGAPVDQPRYVPVNFLRIQHRVETFDDILLVLEDAVHLCTRITSQMNVVKNAGFLIVSLLTHIFIEVFPIPLGPKSRQQKKCMWQAPVKYGQQLQCMTRLFQCAEYFMWSSFSCRTTKEYDAQRIIVLGAIATMGDAVIRLLATDHPSVISQHLRGYKKVPPYGVLPGKMSSQTENSVIIFPQLLTARCAVLDYHAELCEDIPASNVMWNWEEGWGFCKATTSFLRQVCMVEGFATSSVMTYFAMERDGQRCLLGKYWDEYRFHRDMYIMFKWMMAPKLKMPTCQSCMTCKVDSPSVEVDYGNHKLQVRYMHQVVSCRATQLRFPSFAVPSKFTSPFEVTCEDDVLHIKNLPTFDDVMGQRDAELLLSYLTAPYIRIPLVLNFFATEDRVSCLGNTAIKNILEATLFEPGRFLTRQYADKIPEQVPAEEHGMIATPYGILLNELQFSPEGLVTPILRLLKLAREMDAGTIHNHSVVDIILFLVRLVARIDSYMCYALKLAESDKKEFRGMLYPEKSKSVLAKAVDELHLQIQTEVVPMIEAWIDEVMEDSKKAEDSYDIDNATEKASNLHGHLLLLLRNVDASEYTSETASILLSGIIFLTTRHTFNQEILSIPENEVFDVLQRHRRNLINFLYRATPQQMSNVMDSVVRVTTSTGSRTEGPSFDWGYVAGEDCLGRFTRLDADTLKKPNFDSNSGVLQKSLKDHLGIPQFSTPSCTCVNEGLQDVEINIHILSLTFKAAHLVALPYEISDFDDVKTIFTPKLGGNENLLRSMQCAVVHDAENRMWVRLVGQEHDIQYWKTKDPRVPLPNDSVRFYPDDLTPGEQWIVDIVEPVRRAYFVRSFWQPPIYLLLPEHKLTKDQHICVLSAVCSKTAKKLKEIVVYKHHKCCHVYELFSVGRRFYRKLVFTTDCHFTYKELQPDTSDRRNMWRPWQRHAAGDFDCEENTERPDSVVILRHPTHPENKSKSVETFVPARLLHGAIPEELLETHTFWQDPDDNIRGYPNATTAMHLLWLHWKDVAYEAIGGEKREICFKVFRFARAASAPKVSEQAVLKSQKIQFVDEADEELERLRTASCEELDDMERELSEGMYRQATTQYVPKAESATIEDYNLMLINLLCAPKDSPLYSVAQVFARIELLSHVLAWTSQVEYDARSGDPVTLDLVQLPRLKLSFSMRVDADGHMQIFSLDHAHLFISNLRPPLVCQLLQGIPHSLILSDANESISVLVPALEIVRPLIRSAPFSTELVINRENTGWYKKLDTRYYLYPVHVSLSFMFTPTLASALYLLVLRYLHCEYDDVFKLAGSIGTDVEFSPEEEQNFQLLKARDDRPESHACRAKIGLLVADSPVNICWYLPSSTAQMIRNSGSISLSCKLNESEERRLLYICITMLKKMDIIDELVKNVKLPTLVDDLLSRIYNKTPIFQDLSSQEIRQAKQFFKDIETRLRETLDVRVTRDETVRLIQTWSDYRRYSEFPGFLRCLLENRSAYLEAEAAALETGKPVEAVFAVPPMKKDEQWAYYVDYDVMSVKLPAAQKKLKNGEQRPMQMSSMYDYYYCGTNQRKAGMCKCKECGEECGPDAGCPCTSCEAFNKENLSTLRHIPQMLSQASARMLSFYDVFAWIESMISHDTQVRDNLPSCPPEIRAFSPKVRRAAMRDDQNGFLRYYEMMTGTTKIRIGSGDSAKDLVSLLFPLSDEARRPEAALGHLMHYLLNNPQVWGKLPKYNRTSKTTFDSRLSTIYEAILVQASQVNRIPGEPLVFPPRDTKTAVLIHPRPLKRSDPMVPITSTRILPVLTNTDKNRRCWKPTETKYLRVDEGENIAISDLTRNELRKQPLSGTIPEGLVLILNREEQHRPLLDDKLGFDLHKHSAAAKTVAKGMIHRLEKDMQDFAGIQNHVSFPKIRGLSSESEVKHFVMGDTNYDKKLQEDLHKLVDRLNALRAEDTKFTSDAFSVIERTINHYSADTIDRTAEAAMHLRRLAQQEAHLPLSYIIASLASTTAEAEWRELNPFVSADICDAVVSLTIAAVLRANRIGHTNRAAEAAKELLALLHKAEHHPPNMDEGALHNLKEALIASTSQKADSLAGILTTKRVYFEEDWTFDPRFLIFEYTWNLVLRGRQRILIEEIYKSVLNNESIVKQMIMGAGKTTVVGPLLALMLADSKNLVIQVVPPALLDFTRSILRSTFSSVIRKQIFCFVCDRASEVDSEVLSKFHHAKQSRGIVVTTPSSIKSIYLKYIEGLDRIEDTSRKPLPGMEREVHDLNKVLKEWKNAILIMDEVDLLLHPLKSELNFPIGAKHDIDFSPARWRLPIHLVDAIFYFHTRHISVSMKDSPEAHEILKSIQAVLKEGLGINALQATPHLTLLNLEFYEKKMKLPLAKWLLLFLKAHHFAGISDEDTITYVTTRPCAKENPRLNEVVGGLETDHVKTLNLAYDWLTAFLPHVMQKIDRVSFGIMNADDMKRAREEHPNMPRSRFVTSIPFIGKDLPSQSSEFAHPDVVIGLTILAYRYEGLRATDFTDIMRAVHAAVEKEVGRFHQRRTTLMYNKWVQCSGGRILQSFAYGEKKMEQEDEMGMQPSESIVYQDEEHQLKKGQMDVLPLKLMKQANKDETDKLYKLFRRTPEVIHWYLCETIFPDYMRHQNMKLSASGQELGGNVMFERRIGFSGTPSDLLPVELGKCEYEPGTDGQLIHTLTSPHVMNYTIMEPGWTVRSCLDWIANASPPFHALIDTGALITGMSNLQVAQYLLKHGLHQMDGVVFLDEFDRKMILVKATGRVLKLAECGIPKLKRFAFYDQVHTTGMDIEHTPNAMAVQTLGKDMTFRDFSQGAYRMRGIGQGQTVHILIIPEVHDLINRTLSSMRSKDDKHNELMDVTAWLLVNSIRSEHVQHNQLCIQTICNVWRKSAFSNLVKAVEEGVFKCDTKVPPNVKKSLDVYREGVNYEVPKIVPQPRMFSEAIADYVAGHTAFINTEEGKTVVSGIVEMTRKEDEIDNPVIDVQMVQEQEEEREGEQEKEKEQEIELEKFVDLAYSRDEEMPVPWAISSLRSTTRAAHFYKLGEFHLYKRRALSFPDPIMISRNFFNPKWSGHRRIKNVIVTMEWVPNQLELAELPAPCRDYGEVPSAEALEMLLKTVQLLREHQGKFDKALAKEVLEIALGQPDADPNDWKGLDEIQDAGSLLKVLSSNFLRREQKGRYTVALSLCEAETIRRVIHCRFLRNESLLPGEHTSVSLNIAASNDVVLDMSPGFTFGPTNFQRKRAHECLRFFDSDLQYTDQEINYLLRSLHLAPEKVRQAFFLQLIACRRRARQRWEKTPVSLLFNLPNPFTLLHQRAMGLCMLKELSVRELHLADAFVAINSSHSGKISPDELWGALRFCRLSHVTVDDVLSFMQVADTHHEGNIQYPDFLSILTGHSEIDDDEGQATNDALHTKRLPTIEPYGADQLKEVGAEKERARRRLEEEANKDLESEEKRVREEIEQEQMKEELSLIQTCPNPKLLEETLLFAYDTEDIPKLSTFLGPIKARQKDTEELLHFALNEDSLTKLHTRSVKLLRNDVMLREYMFTIEFCLPKPKRVNKKESKIRTLQLIEENNPDGLPLLSFNTNTWMYRSPGSRGGRVRNDDDEEETETDYDDDDDSYTDTDTSSDDLDVADLSVGRAIYVYSAPDKEKKNRVGIIKRDNLVCEIPGERLTTSSGSTSIEWMKICKPMEGYIPFEEGGHRLWTREQIHVNLNANGKLRITCTYLDEPQLPATVFEELKPANAEEDSDSDDDFWDWRFGSDEYDDEIVEEEEEQVEEAYDMGDISDLVAALKKAKELKPGDRVTRNPECWDKGNEDGGEGTVGKVVKVDENNVTVMWPNSHKGKYAWGEQGRFELIKTGSADDEDDLGREVTNDEQWIGLLKKEARVKCYNCGCQVNVELGWFKCNQCTGLSCCKKCFSAMEHPEHEFTDMRQLYESVKASQIVRGGLVRIKPSVKEPANGWGDAPRDGSAGAVLDVDEEAGNVTVDFTGETWLGLISEVAVVDMKFESYAQTWLGLLVNLSNVDRKTFGASCSIVDQELQPPEIVGKYKIGDRIKTYNRYHRKAGGEIRAVLPGEKYAVSFDDGTYTQGIEEKEIEPLAFSRGTKVRIRRLGEDESYYFSLQNGLQAGMMGEVRSIEASSSAVNINVQFRVGMKNIRQNFREKDLILVGTGKWLLHKEGQPPVPLPRNVTVVVEKAFSDGVVTTEEMYIHDGSYYVNLREMALIRCKTEEVIGKLARDPPEEWVEQVEKAVFDDGKWHVLSVIIRGNEDATAICDGKTVQVNYDGPDLEMDEGSDGENEEEEESETNAQYAERIDIPGILAQLSRSVLEERPDDTNLLDCLLKSLEQLQKSDEAPAKAETSDAEEEEEDDEDDTEEDDHSCSRSEEEEERVEREKVESENIAEWEKPEEGDGEETEATEDMLDEHKKGARLKSLSDPKRTISEVLSIDVRLPIAIFSFAGQGVQNERTKFGQVFPTRQLRRVMLSWGAEANSENAAKIFKELDTKTAWQCRNCSQMNSRLLDDCTNCKTERFLSDVQNTGKKSKVRVVLPKSKEAQEVRKRMHGRLRQLYQKQLEQLEDFSSVL